MYVLIFNWFLSFTCLQILAHMVISKNHSITWHYKINGQSSAPDKDILIIHGTRKSEDIMDFFPSI